MEEFYLASNGYGQLHCCKWLPETEPKAVVQIVHGIAEHIGRYDHFARFLTAHGYVVVAEDHMGHGGSVSEKGTKGYFSGGWAAAVADVKALRDKTGAEFPGKPYFILGHSMGSFLLRSYLYTYPDNLVGAVISGTGWEASATVQMGLLLCSLEEHRLGETATSGLLNSVIFGGYNKAFRPNRTKNDWLSTVDAVVDAYNADEMCGFDATVGLTRDMLTGVKANEKPENLEKMPKDLPVLFVSGGKDPVGRMSKGVLQCIDAFKRAGMRDVTIRIYPEGRHEMLNESNRDEVYDNILLWLEQKK